VLVPVNTRVKAAEAGHIIGRSGAKLLLVQENFLGLYFAGPSGSLILAHTYNVRAGDCPPYCGVGSYPGTPKAGYVQVHK
jgi:hypothetical protein